MIFFFNAYKTQIAGLVSERAADAERACLASVQSELLTATKVSVAEYKTMSECQNKGRDMLLAQQTEAAKYVRALVETARLSGIEILRLEHHEQQRRERRPQRGE